MDIEFKHRVEVSVKCITASTTLDWLHDIVGVGNWKFSMGGPLESMYVGFKNSHHALLFEIRK
jgi:hypothetical protein